MDNQPIISTTSEMMKNKLNEFLNENPNVKSFVDRNVPSKEETGIMLAIAMLGSGQPGELGKPKSQIDKQIEYADKIKKLVKEEKVKVPTDAQTYADSGLIDHLFKMTDLMPEWRENFIKPILQERRTQIETLKPEMFDPKLSKEIERTLKFREAENKAPLSEIQKNEILKKALMRHFYERFNFDKLSKNEKDMLIDQLTGQWKKMNPSNKPEE